MGLFGSPDIETLEAKKDVRRLTKALRNESEDLRARAAEALGRLGNREAAEPLIAALGDGSWYVRRAAVQALGAIADPVAADPLTRALSDESDEVREEATQAISRIGGPAVDGLVAALDIDDEDLRSRAAQALGRIGDPRTVPALVDLLRRSPDEPPRKPWATNARRAVAGALGEIGDVRAVDALIEALGDEDHRVHRSAVSALAQIGEPAVEPLIDAMGRADVRVREGAAGALGELAEPRALEPLLTALHDAEVRQTAAWALGRIGDVRAIGPLRAAGGPNVPPALGNILTAAWGQGAIGDDPELTRLNGIVERCVRQLVELYDRTDGKGFEAHSARATAVEQVGETLDREGGFPLMRLAHERFGSERAWAARNLASVWDGVGLWSG